LDLIHKVRHDGEMRSATVSFATLIAIANTLCFAAEPPSLDPDVAAAPSTRLLQTLKHAMDSDQFLQELFFSDENLKTFFDATSIRWFIKDGDRPYVGRISAIRSALLPEADIRASSLFVPGASNARSVSIAITGVPLTQDEVIAVFGTPVAWTRRGDPHGDRIPLPLHFGDADGPPIQKHWDGVAKKGASFSVAHNGSVNGILMWAIGPVGDAKPQP
jgi:hypothetical protein